MYCRFSPYFLSDYTDLVGHRDSEIIQIVEHARWRVQKFWLHVCPTPWLMFSLGVTWVSGSSTLQLVCSWLVGRRSWLDDDDTSKSAQSEQLKLKRISRVSSLHLGTLGREKGWGRQKWSGRNLLGFWLHMFDSLSDFLFVHIVTHTHPLPPPQKLRVPETTHQRRS